MYLQYNSWEAQHKQPFGAVQQRTPVTFHVFSDADAVYLHGFGDGRLMDKSDNNFTITITPDISTGLYHYSFEAIFYDTSVRYGRSLVNNTADIDGPPYQLTVYKERKTPEWFKGSIMYQIYVDRYYASPSDETTIRAHALIHTSWNDPPLYAKNEKGEIVLWDFYGGNLQGVIDKLPYLRSLGVDIIYLNPIFEASSNHKYDTGDYSKVDPMYGNEDTLHRLTSSAKKLDMHIMLDGVFSHTGADSLYFNRFGTYGTGGAYNDPQSPYHSWYNFTQYPNEYEGWWGNESLPCVNELDEGYLRVLLDQDTGIVPQWMRAGVAGWRLDVADELPDEFIRRLKSCVLEVNPDAILLGEVWEDASNKISYDQQRQYILGDALDSVTNYPLRQQLIALLCHHTTPLQFGNTIMHLQENYPREIFLSLMNMTGTHDSIRLLTELGDAPHPDGLNTWQQRLYQLSDPQRALAHQRLYAFYTVLYMLPGNPCIYYGDELGLQGYADPYNRGTFDWDHMDDNLIQYIQSLASLRDRLSTRDGWIQFHHHEQLLIIQITSDKASYALYLNPLDHDVLVPIPDEIHHLHHAKREPNNIVLAPYGVMICTV